MNKLVILDFFLRDKKGHDQHYDFSLAAEAIRQGVSAEIWCGDRGDNCPPDFVKQCLTSKPPPRRTLRSKALSALARTVELRKIFAQSTLDGDTVILIPSIDSHLLLDLSLGLLGRPVKSKIVIVLRRGLKDHLCSLDPVKARLKTLLTSPFLKYLHDKKRVLLFTDSELITEELISLGFGDSRTLPIPHLPPRQQPARRSGEVVIGCFGGARFDKGFDLLPEIVDSVLKRHANVSFIVQSFLFDKSPVIESARQKLIDLSRSSPEKLSLLDNYLSDRQYAESMAKCSIVLIPYRKEFYGKGTSGVLAEAIACGAWSVVPADTWMAAQKPKYSRIVSFDSLDAKAIMGAIDFCVHSQGNFDIQKTSVEIDEWYKFHSPENYIGVLRSCFQETR
jgi:glycosyltransferase involved in cell wall biosynthesis